MMDTVLNLGLNDDVVEGFCSSPTTSEAERRFCLDAYRRLLDMFGDVVLSIPRVDFESALTEMKRARGVATDAELTADDLRELCDKYKRVYVDRGETFPSDPETQLRMSIEAVFASWNNPRAVKYREINKDCAGLEGTAVNVQAMVFGNRDDSCSGVLFRATRPPARRSSTASTSSTPRAKTWWRAFELRRTSISSRFSSRAATRLWSTGATDWRTTSGTSWTSSSRSSPTSSGSSSAARASGSAPPPSRSPATWSTRASSPFPARFSWSSRGTWTSCCGRGSTPRDLGSDADVVARGLPASPGAAVGTIVFTAADAEAAKKRGVDCVLIRVETSAEDVGGMHASCGHPHGERRDDEPRGGGCSRLG